MTNTDNENQGQAGEGTSRRQADAVHDAAMTPAGANGPVPRQDAIGGLFAPESRPKLIYILYLAGFFTGISAIAGVILAILGDGKEDPVVASHYEYQKKTFFFGLLYLFMGFVLSIILIGYFVLLAWVIWTLVRCIKGLDAFSKGKPIQQAWLW